MALSRRPAVRLSKPALCDHMYRVEGELLSVTEIARRLGLTYVVAHKRLIKFRTNLTWDNLK